MLAADMDSHHVDVLRCKDLLIDRPIIGYRCMWKYMHNHSSTPYTTGGYIKHNMGARRSVVEEGDHSGPSSFVMSLR